MNGEDSDVSARDTDADVSAASRPCETDPAIPSSEKQPLQLSLFDHPVLCCSCRRLRGRNRRWSRRRVDQEWFPQTAFSHGICPACFRRHYPEAHRRRLRSRAATASRKPEA